MKHIKLYEHFNEINEAEKQLPGGYVNQHIATTKDESKPQEKGKTYFLTNLTNPSDAYGSPGTLEVDKHDGRVYQTLFFPSSDFEPQQIEIGTSDFTDMPKDFEQAALQGPKKVKSVLAKTPAEAKAKALDILLAANLLANGSYESKEIGNLIKAFFEIQKMYPEYMTKNPLFGGFIQGLSTAWMNPKFSADLGINDYNGDFKSILGQEIKKALTEIGVIKPKA